MNAPYREAGERESYDDEDEELEVETGSSLVDFWWSVMLTQAVVT